MNVWPVPQRCAFRQRFAGHRNVDTDIKEANFFRDLVISGSDDGCAYIWHKLTGRLVAVLPGVNSPQRLCSLGEAITRPGLQADSNIVNCVQPHPFDLAVATSGIDSEVRIWLPGEGPFRSARVHAIHVLRSQGASEHRRDDASKQSHLAGCAAALMHSLSHGLGAFSGVLER